MQASHVLDRIVVTADDVSLVADAGLILPATLGQRLGLPGLLDTRVTAGANAADKCLTVIHSALAGGDCIDDVAALRAGSTAAVLGHRAVAPSTVGTFLRSMSWGHARQLDAVSRELLARAAATGAIALDPSSQADRAGPVVLDIDATLVQTYGLAKSGARHVMRTGRRGYHPLLAVLGGTGEVVHARLRRGRSNDSTGAPSFVAEAFSRLRAAGANGPMVLRADTGFYLAEVLAVCRRHQVGYSIGARMIGRMRAVIAGIDEQQWTEVPYFEPGAAVAEIGWRVFDQHRGKAGPWRGNGTWVRLIVRRTPTPPQIRARHQTAGQQELFPSYEYHPFITDQPGDPVDLDAFHRAHAEVELAIRDLKYGLALNHLPTGRFGANHAWLILQTIAHNLGRWTARLGELAATPRQTIKTLRRRYLAIPARLVGHARRHRLRLPAHWPWAGPLLAALARLRALPAPAG